MMGSLQSQVSLAKARWRRGRRLFDSRLLNERRLLIVAAAAFCWFVLDSLLVTPSYASFHAVDLRNKASSMALDAMRAEMERTKHDLALKESEAVLELARVRERIERSKQALAQQQAMLVPAREMRTLMDGLLAQNGRLQLTSMRTMPPEEVKFTPMPGLAISQALLYRQGLEVAVSGSFMEGLTWLRSIEALPRKLLWDGLTMKVDDRGVVTLILKVHTYSPDRDPLEIQP